MTAEEMDEVANKIKTGINSKTQKEEIVDVNANKPTHNKSKKMKRALVISSNGENARYNAHAIEVMSLPKINYLDPLEIRQRSLEYFDICQVNDIKPSVAGYALALGITRVTLQRWIQNTPGHEKPPEVREELERFYAALNMQLEDSMQGGKVNPIPAIFLAKNNFGYKDQTETLITANRIESTNPDTLIEESNLLSDDIID